MSNTLDHSQLKKDLNYNPDTGEITLARTIERVGQKGRLMGCTFKRNGRPSKCQNISYRGKRYLLHRLAWFYVHGYMPKFIDHINGDSSDNRLCNLREVTVTENNRNVGKQSNNKSGFTGVSWNKSKCRWGVQIWHKSKPINMGWFKEQNNAILARKIAEKVFGYHENHGNERYA